MISSARAAYLLRSFVRLGNPASRQCPNCLRYGEAESRKYLFFVLRRCPVCGVLYRTPTDRESVSLSFYEQEQYRQGFTTELPDDAALSALLRTSFGGTEKDYRVYIE